MLTCLVPVLFTFYTQGVLKLKKNNSSAKGLRTKIPTNILRTLDNNKAILTPAHRLRVVQKAIYRTAWLKDNTAEVPHSLWFLVRVFAVTMCCVSPQQRLLTEIACTDTKTSTSHVLPHS
jgi:hypothetical protein